MSDSTAKFDAIVQSQSTKEATANAAFDAVSQAMIFGRRQSTSTGLTWGYFGGRFTKPDGTNINVANGTVALSASTINYVEVDKNATVSKNTAGFSASATPLYTIVTGTATVTSWTDHRDGTQGNRLARGKRAVSLTFATTMTINWDEVDVARVTLTDSISALTFTAGYDGQAVTLKAKQDATGSRTMPQPANVRVSVDIPWPTLTTTGSKMDYLGFVYDATDSKWDLVAVTKGF